jgi:hypothetical protein
VGWIIFNTKEAADKAKQKLSQLVLPGESKPLFVDYCDERSNKKPETEKRRCSFCSFSTKNWF